MKKFVIIVMLFCFAISSYAQQKNDTSSTASEKSSTVSALCTAQEEIIQEILGELYASDGKIDVIKEYEVRIKPSIAECLKLDMYQTGIKVRENALQGKFKKIRLSFEKPTDNTFKISGKTKRMYKRTYKKFKKEFIGDRKGKTLNDILGEKNLLKKVGKVGKTMTRQFKKDVNKISK